MAVAAFTALAQTVMTIAGGTAFSAMTFLGATGFQAYLAMTATYAVLGAVSRELFAQPSLDTMNGINYNVRDPAATRKIIYGKCRVGGAIVFFNTSDTNNNYLHLVIAVAGHEIESYEEVYFGDTKVWENGSYVNDGTTDWEDHCLLSFHKGDQTTADSTLVDAATGFTNDHKLLDTAYVYVRLDYNAEVYVSGVPNVSFVVKGKKVLDPRTSTTAYSNNPALIARDYLTDTQYGLGESSANIDNDSVIASANICDATVTITGGTQKAFECDGVLDTGTNIKVNLESILSSMIGSVSYYNGKFSIIAHNHYTPVADAIDTSMIVSPIQVSTKRSRKSQHNTVKGQFISEENDYVVADYPIQKNASYITQDGQEMPLNLTLAMTTNNVRAQRIAKLVMEKSRQQMTISLELNLSGLKYAVGDNIKINYERFSWTNKEFEITSLQLLPDPERGLIVAIQAVENNASAYDWVAGDATAFVVATEVDVYSGTTVVAPSNLRVYRHPNGLYHNFRFTWTGVQEADGADPYEPYFDHYEIYISGETSFDTVLREVHHLHITKDASLDRYLTHRNASRTQFAWYIYLRAFNIRGYASDVVGPLSLVVRDYGSLEEDPRQDYFVTGTEANPSIETINDLAIEKGIPVENNVQVTYIQVDNNNTIVDTVEYIFDNGSLDSKLISSRTEVDTTIDEELFPQGDYNDANAIYNSSEFNVANGVLTGTGVLLTSFSGAFCDLGTNTQTIQVEVVIDSITLNDSASRVRIGIYPENDLSTPLASRDYDTSGTKTFQFGATTQNVAVVVTGNSHTNSVDVVISNLSVKLLSLDAGEEYAFIAPTSATDVTWSKTLSNSTGLNDTGVSLTENGFTGVNKELDWNGDGKQRYATVKLERTQPNTGFSQTTVTVTAEWVVPEVTDGVLTNTVRTASNTKTLTAVVI